MTKLRVIGMRDRPRPFTAGKDSAVLSRLKADERPGKPAKFLKSKTVKC